VSLGFGAVRRAGELGNAEPVTLPLPRPLLARLARGEVLRPEVVAAAAAAENIVRRAEERAREIVARAEADAASLHARVESDARAEGALAVAEKTLALAALEADADARALDRSVGLARLLAERLLGEALALDPARVAALARTALAEARGARQVTLVAHPDDLPLLEPALVDGGLRPVTRLVADAERPRGSLRFETEIGVLDAAIAPQLDRLAARLRETLRHER